MISLAAIAMFQDFDLRQTLLRLVVLILSLSVHEWAHAISAHKLGDDTAEREGRLTLNPISHIDPIGTILLPLLNLPFGWAKPVPVRPERFSRGVNMKTGMAITSFAGPLSNFVLALLSAIMLVVLSKYAPSTVVYGAPAAGFLQYGVLINISLAVFNLLPIPPLDGHRLLERVIPSSMEQAWESFVRLGPFLLLGLIWFGGRLLSGPIQLALEYILSLARTIGSLLP